MKITVAVITPQDYEKFNAVGMNAEACLADCVKLILSMACLSRSRPITCLGHG